MSSSGGVGGRGSTASAPLSPLAQFKSQQRTRAVLQTRGDQIQFIHDRMALDLRALDDEIAIDRAASVEYEKQLAKLQRRREEALKRIAKESEWTRHFDAEIGPFEARYKELQHSVDGLHREAKGKYDAAVQLLVRTREHKRATTRRSGREQEDITDNANPFAPLPTSRSTSSTIIHSSSVTTIPSKVVFPSCSMILLLDARLPACSMVARAPRHGFDSRMGREPVLRLGGWAARSKSSRDTRLGQVYVMHACILVCLSFPSSRLSLSCSVHVRAVGRRAGASCRVPDTRLPSLLQLALCLALTRSPSTPHRDESLTRPIRESRSPPSGTMSSLLARVVRAAVRPARGGVASSALVAARLSANSSSRSPSWTTGAAVLSAAVASAALSTAAHTADAEASASSSAASSSVQGPHVPTESRVRVGLVQLAVGSDKAANLAAATSQIESAVRQGAKLVVLPEMFNCPYSNASFNPYSEVLPSVGSKSTDLDEKVSPTSALMSRLARTHGVYLVAGSIPERAPFAAGERHASSGLAHHLYNTSLVFSPEGEVVAKHRKAHLFDIDVPGKMTFRESDTLSPGSEFTLFDTPFARVGLGICYDIRFGEYAQALTERGATMLIYPGAFNTTTGPLHWELLQRARAVDNQLWVLTCSPARSEDRSAYQAWGHSSAISPWGRVVATTEHEPSLVLADIDMTEVSDMRASIPVSKQKRNDLYKLKH